MSEDNGGPAAIRGGEVPVAGEELAAFGGAGSPETARDVVAIEQVLHAYCHAVGRGSLAQIMSLFSEDCVLEPVYESDEIYRGREAVSAWFEGFLQRSRAALRYLRHRVSTPLIRVDQERASSISYLDADTIPVASGEVAVTAGRYDDELALEGGVWRLKRRVIHVYHQQVTGPFKEGRQPGD